MAKEKKDTTADEAAKISFHAAILQPDGTYCVESFPSAEDLANRLKTLINQDVSVFAFQGDRLHVSKGPLRYLLVPGVEPIALYDVPKELEPDDTGYLGIDPIHLGDPPQLRMPATGRPTTPQQDEFFDGDSGSVLGAFDDVLPDPDS